MVTIVAYYSIESIASRGGVALLGISLFGKVIMSVKVSCYWLLSSLTN